MTTTTNASMMIVVSITIVSGSRGTWSAPPRPARPLPSDEHGGEEARLVDAERRDHLAVLRRGADQDAPARAVEEPHSASATSGPTRSARGRRSGRAARTIGTDPASPGAVGPVLLSAPQMKCTTSATTSTSANVSRSW